MHGFPYVAVGIPAHTPSPHAVQSRSRSPHAKDNEEDEHPVSEIGAGEREEIRQRDRVTETLADVDTEQPIATTNAAEPTHAAEQAASQPLTCPQV